MRSSHFVERERVRDRMNIVWVNSHSMSNRVGKRDIFINGKEVVGSKTRDMKNH